jgi:hypothetical protein
LVAMRGQSRGKWRIFNQEPRIEGLPVRLLLLTTVFLICFSGVYAAWGDIFVDYGETYQHCYRLQSDRLFSDPESPLNGDRTGAFEEAGQICRKEWREIPPPFVRADPADFSCISTVGEAATARVAQFGPDPDDDRMIALGIPEKNKIMLECYATQKHPRLKSVRARIRAGKSSFEINKNLNQLGSEQWYTYVDARQPVTDAKEMSVKITEVLVYVGPSTWVRK